MTRARIFKNKRSLIDATIAKSDSVLDIGFSGQGVTADDALLTARAKEVCDVDLAIDRERFPDTARYQEASAESFSFKDQQFDVVFAGDVIEHLPTCREAHQGRTDSELGSHCLL